jgi:hypothetical protein
MADHCHHHHSRTSAEVRAGTSWAQDNPPVLYYKGHWLSTSVAEPLVASERLEQYDALGHRKCVPCSDEFAPKPFGVHSNELVNHEYTITTGPLHGGSVGKRDSQYLRLFC